jgi:hypothetical protein
MTKYYAYYGDERSHDEDMFFTEKIRYRSADEVREHASQTDIAYNLFQAYIDVFEIGSEKKLEHGNEYASKQHKGDK